ncbi:MAG TPA: hypothetical protein VFF65_03320 [Phycisphaerales bacterium]|nr:hypothetical protein [Phycisphaerales bacterium]
MSEFAKPNAGVLVVPGRTGTPRPTPFRGPVRVSAAARTIHHDPGVRLDITDTSGRRFTLSMSRDLIEQLIADARKLIGSESQT